MQNIDQYIKQRLTDLSLIHILENVRLNLDLELDELLLVIIAIAFAGYQNEEVSSCVGVILCHGYSTASSIADTANRMLGQYVFDGIDMEINITIDKVAQLADDYLKRKGTIHELIFLVDMGSLEEIYTRIKPMSDYNIALINNVSTAMALEVGNYIMQGKRVEEILQLVKEHHQLSTHYLKSRKKKSAILSICATGFGAVSYTHLDVYKRQVMDITERIVKENHITTLMITHNMKQALEYGNKTIILNEGKIVKVLEGEERKNTTVDDLLNMYDFV